MRAVLLTLVLFQVLYTSRAELLVIPVTVVDRGGEPVSDLEQKDFRVSIGGKPARIETFHAGETPLSVGLVVDYSLSMEPKMRDVLDAVDAFARRGRADDEMFFVRFNNEIAVNGDGGTAFTSDAARLGALARAAEPMGQTALFDAVGEALQHVAEAKWDRKVLVVISDGGDNASGRTAAQVLAQARESQAVIYTIGVRTADDGKKDLNVLEQLARRSGGAAFVLQSSRDIGPVMQRIARELCAQYTLGLSPDAGLRGAVRVDVSHQGRGSLHARARRDIIPASAR